MSGNATTSPAAPPPRDRRRAAALRVAGRLLLAAVFLMAAVTKVTDLGRFEEQTVLHAHLPPWAETAVVDTLPWLELVCGAALALGYAPREAALVAGVLLAAFLVHHLVNHAERDCGCFLFPGLVPAELSWWPPVRDALLLTVAAGVWWGYRSGKSTR